MKIKAIYDNGGTTFDRYNVIFDNGESLGLSHNPDSPQGFSQWGAAIEGDHLGIKIEFESLPENIKEHIKKRGE